MRLLHRTTDRSSVEPCSESEAFVASAQEHFANAFPNPQREGCPAAGVIQTIVKSERLPDDALQAHLFGCSECFNRYRSAVRIWQMEKQRAARLGRHSIWEMFWNWRVPVGIAATALLLSASLWLGRTSSPQPNQLDFQPTPLASLVAKGPQPEPVGATSPTPAKPALPNAQPPLLAVKVDLNEYRSLGAQQRNSNEADSPVTLHRARLRLRLTLRENSPAGNYRISVLENGRLRATASARSRDGNTLPIVLDLRHVVGPQARLRIERAGQNDVAPDEYQVKMKSR